MRNKIVVLTVIILTAFILDSVQTFALEDLSRKTVVKPIGEILANKLIREHTGKIQLRNLKDSDRIDPEQSFKINVGTKIFYIISAHRNTPSDNNLMTCSVLLFDEIGTIKSAFDIMGNDDEKRPWYCDHVEAMSFKDMYPDGNLKIIGLYRGTPPSSEHFVLPVIMKLNVIKPSLEIDEDLTSELEGADIISIQDVRSYLKKHYKK